MNRPLLLRTAGALLMCFTTEVAYCADDNFMLRYACVDARFREQIPPPSVIDAEDNLDVAAIQNVARRIPKDLQVALSETANLSIITAVIDS